MELIANISCCIPQTNLFRIDNQRELNSIEKEIIDIQLKISQLLSYVRKIPYNFASAASAETQKVEGRMSESLMGESMCVISYLNLYSTTKNDDFKNEAIKLIEMVHQCMGHNDINFDNFVYLKGNRKPNVQKDQHVDNLSNNQDAGESDLDNLKQAESENDEFLALSYLLDCIVEQFDNPFKDETSDAEMMTLANRDPIANGLRSVWTHHPLDCNLPPLSHLRHCRAGQSSGQHIHQLAKWIFCLVQTSKVTLELKYGLMALKLAKHVFKKFHHDKGSSISSLYWKMDDRLNNPLIVSEGLLDCFTCLVVFAAVQDWYECNQQQIDDDDDDDDLSNEISQLEQMVNLRIKHIRSGISEGQYIGEALWICSIGEQCSSISNKSWIEQLRKNALMYVKEYVETALIRSKFLRCSYDELFLVLGMENLSSSSSSSSLAFRKEWASTFDLMKDIRREWKYHLFYKDHCISASLYCLSLYPGFYFQL